MTPKINAPSQRPEISSRDDLPPLEAHLEELRLCAEEFLRQGGEPQARDGSSGSVSADPFQDPLVARGLALIRELGDATRQVDMRLEGDIAAMEMLDPALAASLRRIKEAG